MKTFHLDQNDEAGWERLSEERLFYCPHIQVDRVTYRTPGRPGERVVWTVARRKNAVIVAPKLEDGRFLLIRQERLPIQRTIWEFPAGQIDEIERKDDPEIIRATAVRELEEETGYRLKPEQSELVSLGYYFSSQGFTDEHAYLFLANHIEAIPGREEKLGEKSEHIAEARAFTFKEIQTMICDNVIVDANTLVLTARLMCSGLA